MQIVSRNGGSREKFTDKLGILVYHECPTIRLQHLFGVFNDETGGASFELSCAVSVSKNEISGCRIG